MLPAAQTGSALHARQTSILMLPLFVNHIQAATTTSTLNLPLLPLLASTAPPLIMHSVLPATQTGSALLVVLTTTLMLTLFVSQTLVALAQSSLIQAQILLLAKHAPPLSIPNALLAAQTGSALLAVPTTILMQTSLASQTLIAILTLNGLILCPVSLFASTAPPLTI